MNRKRIVLMFLCVTLLLVQPLTAQEAREKNVSFAAPFDFPLYLSGNFGELRSGHFHGGLDFKTQGVTGKAVHSIERGYISRVCVSAGGYGNALYIKHPCGYTSVYGHLQSLLEGVARRVREYQYAHRTFAVDLEFDSLQFPVARGQVVARSGNTGYSFGPHLHMEIRRTDTEEPVNPLLFYRDKIKDTRPPQASELLFCPDLGRGVVNGGTQKVKRAVAGNGLKGKEEELTAWGKIGVAVRGEDMMNETHNRYGIYSISLSVDGKELFYSRMDAFSFEENRYIDAWSDFAEYRRSGRRYLKTFIEPGNPLRLIRADGNDGDGRIIINEERPYRFELTLSDLNGNSSTYRFTIQGVEQEIPLFSSADGIYLPWDLDHEIQSRGMTLTLPKGSLCRDMVWHVQTTEVPDAPSFTYTLNHEPFPLYGGALLKIRINRFPVADSIKYYIQKVNSDGTYSMGGKYEAGAMIAAVNETGTYTVGIDTLPPVIRSIRETQRVKSGVVAYRIYDEHTGIKDYQAFLDGAFILFKHSAKNGCITCNLREEGIERGRHNLRLTVTDHCGNITEINEEINY